MRAFKYISSALLVIMMIGCAPVISKDVLKGIDQGIQFRQIHANPEQYIGKKALLGGTILNIENRENFTFVEVLEQPLGSQMRPGNPENSQGRFLVRFSGFRDPAIITKGRMITVAGTITGTERMFINKMPYDYPVIEPIEFHLWDEYRDSGPNIGIGLGIGILHTD